MSNEIWIPILRTISIYSRLTLQSPLRPKDHRPFSQNIQADPTNPDTKPNWPAKLTRPLWALLKSYVVCSSVPRDPVHGSPRASIFPWGGRYETLGMLIIWTSPIYPPSREMSPNRETDHQKAINCRPITTTERISSEFISAFQLTNNPTFTERRLLKNVRLIGIWFPVHPIVHMKDKLLVDIELSRCHYAPEHRSHHRHLSNGGNLSLFYYADAVAANLCRSRNLWSRFLRRNLFEEVENKLGIWG